MITGATPDPLVNIVYKPRGICDLFGIWFLVKNKRVYLIFKEFKRTPAMLGENIFFSPNTLTETSDLALLFVIVKFSSPSKEVGTKIVLEICLR